MQISSDHSLLILNGEIRRKKFFRSDLLCVTVGWSDLMFLILDDPIRRNMRLSNKIRRTKIFWTDLSRGNVCREIRRFFPSDSQLPAAKLNTIQILKPVQSPGYL
jgi:hypothetical protein